MSSASPAGAPVRLDVGSRSGAYPVHIAAGLFKTLPALLDDARVPARRFVVSNPTIWRLHGRSLPDLTSDEPILIPDGERFKHLQTVGRIYDALIRMRADRSSAIVAVGGGVVGDIAGFAAATYLRGLALVQVPTTLLAQVDSAIGGKVGVNHAAGKNLIGAFHPPAVVAIDPHVLATLPRREFRAGLYEAIKYGIIESRSLFDRVHATLTPLFAREPGALLPVISESCAIKGRIVEQDERESGLRRTLNFGHTIGHALEAVTKYRRFRHGEAIAYGMLVAAAIGTERGTMPPEDFDALKAVITQMGPLPAVTDQSIVEVLEAVGRDKKIVEGRLHFVLPGPIGTTSIVDDVTEAELTRELISMGLHP
ncbi:MAG: 3-dehydroquinate synthase [Acidobacteria bacterium]|nr:MAG: 3-dehydroquinate synthase [Acidobacteriota bacterium]